MNLLDKNILHLWYPIADVQKEISMRTAYLGKHRSSESSPHLLDLIHLTTDEQKLFLSYAQNAMADVHDLIGKYALRLSVQSYRWNEGVATVAIPTAPVLHPVDVEKTILTAPAGLVSGCILFNIPEHYAAKYTPYIALRLTISTKFQFKGTDIDISGTPIELFRTLEAKLDTDTGKYRVDFSTTVELEGPTDNMTATTIESVEADIIEAKEVISTPAPIEDNSWITYDGKNFINSGMTTDKDFVEWYESIYSLQQLPEDKKKQIRINPYYQYSHPLDIVLAPEVVQGAFEEQKKDMRQSIHYTIEFPPYLSPNYIEPMDVALREALVCHIISHWLETAYPVDKELERWNVRYAAAAKSVRDRLNVFRPQVGKITPHWI